MELQHNSADHISEAPPRMRFSDAALRFALWVVYGGEAGELVYHSGNAPKDSGDSAADSPSAPAN
jgi:hypothetical protein